MLTNSQITAEFRGVHGYRYIYSLVNYTKATDKLIIICPEHGEFRQTRNAHLSGAGCRRCYNKKQTITVEVFLIRARIIHGDRYDYSKVVYVRSTEKVIIVCPVHGEFLQTPNAHMNGKGCRKCGYAERTGRVPPDLGSFKIKATEVHGEIYGYEETLYPKGATIRTKLDILCRTHGVFQQTIGNHLSSSGCPKCSRVEQSLRQATVEWSDKLRWTQGEFESKATEKHAGIYKYSKAKYLGSREPILIICPKGHEFWQTPETHLKGCGCTKCSHHYSKPHQEIEAYLETLGLVRVKLTKEEILAYLENLKLTRATL